jgi:hypothetical protein
MTKGLKAVGILAVALGLAVSAAAGERGGRCSLRAASGHWIFATDVGQYPAGGGDITALGSFDVDGEGNVNGIFDATLATVAFIPGCVFSGKMTIEPDCRGTLTFETCTGAVRTDSIALVSRSEIWGMSQDPGNLWNYKARKISRH